MAYLSRKEAPLFYNGFLKFVMLPLITALQAFLLYLIVDLVFGDASGYGAFENTLLEKFQWLLMILPGFVTLILSSAGILAASVILHLAALIGLLRWKRYGKNTWLLILTVHAVLLTACCVLLFTRFSVIEKEPQLFQLYAEMFGTTSSQLSALLAIGKILFAASAIIVILFLIMNFVYYFKRRKLFATYYAEPLEPSDSFNVDPSAEIETEVIPSEEQEITGDTVKNTDDSSNILFCPDCGAKVTSGSEFCENCGRKLINE